MKWITVGNPSASLTQVDSVLSQLDGAPDGLEARYIGTADDGNVRIVALWQSKAHAERFFAEKLGPAVARALGPDPVGAPELVGIDVERTYVREAVA